MSSNRDCSVALTCFDKLVVSISYLMLLALWFLLLLAFPLALFLAICIIASLLFIGLSILMRYPHRLNYPLKISAHNSTKQYQLAVRFLRIIRLSLLVLFLGVGLLVSTNMEYSPLVAVILVVLLMVVPLIVYILKAIRLG